MSASNEVRFKIGADTSALSRGFVEAGSIAAAAGGQIERKLGLKDAFKSTVLALGLSIEKISEKIAEMLSGGSQEAWRSALESANQSARLIEEMTLRRMSTVRQIAELEKEIARHAADQSHTPQKTGELNTARRVLDTIGEQLFSGLAAGMDALGLKSGAAAQRRTAAMFRARGNETGPGTETQAEADKRANAEDAAQLARILKQNDLKEKQLRDEERIAAARRDLARLTMTDAEKAVALQDEMLAAYDKVAEAMKKGADTTQLNLEAIAKQKALQEKLLEIEKKQTDEAEKQKKARESFLEKYRAFLNAQSAGQARVGEARQSLADARHDQVAFTVEEAAGGKRGNSRDRARARAILRDEATAKSLFDSGRTVTQFDSATQKNVERGSSFFQTRAANERLAMGNLKTSEKNQLSTQEKLLYEANNHLKNIERSLVPVDVE